MTKVLTEADAAAGLAGLPRAVSLPERDPTKPAEQQGLFRKFEVYRTDRSDAGPGCKHYGCDYFVLDITHDQHAKAALAAYADAVEATHPELAADMRARYALVSERDALAGRVAELEADRAWLEKRWNKVIDAAQHAHGPDAIRFKFSLRKNGTAMNNFPKWLDGRWVSFVFAEDDAHIGYIAKAIAALSTTPESKP